MGADVERRLRHGLIFAFGLLYLLSYLPMTLLAFAMINPYALGVTGRIGEQPDFALFVFGMLLLGILLLLAIRFRRAFGVLAVIVLAVHLTVLIAPFFAANNPSFDYLVSYAMEMNAVTMLFSSLFSSFVSSYDALDAILSVLNALLWLLPFIVYYLVRFLYRTKGERVAL